MRKTKGFIEPKGSRVGLRNGRMGGGVDGMGLGMGGGRGAGLALL